MFAKCVEGQVQIYDELTQLEVRRYQSWNMIGYGVELNKKLQISVSVNYAELKNHSGKTIERSNNDLYG